MSKTHLNIKIITDTGYQGLKKLHARTQMSKRKTNQHLARERVLNENVIDLLKRFEILADRYRNRRKRFGLRFNLISGSYNLELC